MKHFVFIVFFSFCYITSSNANFITEPGPKKVYALYVSQFENVLGTSMEVKIRAASENKAVQAENAIVNEIKRLNQILSGYDQQSEFNRWLKTYQEAIPVSAELMEVLQLFEDWKKRTDGALDASAQVIGTVWKNAAAQKSLPAENTIREAIVEVQNQHWQLNAKAQTATHLSHSPLMMNSFAKSYIIRKAAESAMKIADVDGAVINIGGDIVVLGNIVETIQISNPKADAENDQPIDVLHLNGAAIATSGNYRRGVMINEKWYSHIVDPRNGMPADNIISATVVSPNATDAGALATAFNILNPEESEKIASNIPGTEYLLITKDGQRISSPGWDLLRVPDANTNSQLLYNQEQWNKGYELLVNLELAQLPGFGRRPFVAVWVEDKDKKSVRTIAVWFNKERWLHDLRLWYSGNYASFNGTVNTMASISSATRSAGKYSLKWDGKDNKGNFVAPGKYTIYIEAVREHGTYQLIKQEMDLSNKAQIAILEGNVEITGASFEYRKKTDK